jgi:DNA-binding MarR family transcriptional regulator
VGEHVGVESAEFDPHALRLQGETSLARRMLQIYRTFNALAQQKYVQRGHVGLTPAHTALVAQLDAGGTRIVTLAERMGLTKQFAGRLVEELRQKGYVSVEPDPADRRASRVRVTAQGWQFLIDACAVRDEIEGTFEAALGSELMADFTRAIERLADLGVDVSGSLEPLDQLPS